MILARVEGNVTSTRKHPSFSGWKLLICQPINEDGGVAGVPVVAIDTKGAGARDRVIVSTDGHAARTAVGDNMSPARHMIVAIVDEIEAKKGRAKG
ncbi:MAG: EutN/CcmL family microcompartment protein [Phycisphaeraceae bacterium]